MKAEELHVRRLELELQRDNQAAEADRRKQNDESNRLRHENPAARTKLYGEALKNAVTRMPNDPVEALAFFRNIEKMFETLEVPEELQG